MVAPEAACVETHISWVLLSGDRAFKVYKPVAIDVLDHRGADQRRSACQRELALNARLAPDVYQGVAEIALDGEALEPVLVMRRMPASRRLSSLLDAPDALHTVRAVARKVATFHSSLPALPDNDAQRVASAEALGRRWAQDVATLVALAGEAVVNAAAEMGRLAGEYIAGRDPLFAERIRSGMVRDGHGDLLAEDIFCLEDGPRILDCLAFRDELRWGDVLGDTAFLVMDLQRLGHPGLARTFLGDYCDFSGESHPGSLAHLYVAQRALVRAKVAALRASQTGAPSPEASRLADLVIDHLERAEVRLALLGGLPGSGKSTLADRMSEEFGWAVLSSDEVRRDLGLRYRDLHDPSAYDPATVARVYQELRSRAGQLIGQGISVILDATWTSAAERERARALAQGGHARLLEVLCRAPVELCRARVRERSDPAESEATAAVVDLLASRADPWPEAIVHDTTGAAVASRSYLAQAAALWWRSQPEQRQRPPRT